MTDWEKNETLRNIKSEKYLQKLKNCHSLNLDISLFEVEYLNSVNYIPLPGYDTISVTTVREINPHLLSIESNLTPFTTALIPFQIPASKKGEILNFETAEKIIFRNSSYVIDCEHDNDTLLANMNNRKRQYISNFKKSKSELISCKRKLQKIFFDFYSFTVSFLSFSEKQIWSKSQINRLLERDDTLLLGLATNGTVQMIHMIGVDNISRQASFCFSVYGSETARGHSLKLFWESFAFLRNLGVSQYHLGGGVSPGDGVERFKKELGAKKHINFCIPLIQDKDLYTKLYDSCKPAQRVLGKFPAYLTNQS